ncbi:MAG TPA: hypothetical protein P5218_16035, partial [Planctomycetota bacterium]|nr:hypothetical protein [Planctomycetota bacterium]
AFWGVVILGGAAIATTVIAGPRHTQQVVGKIRAHVQEHLNHLEDDPVSLRAELQRLEAEYPKRISAVQKDLGELVAEAGRLQWERAVSLRVVEMAQADLQSSSSMAGESQTGLIRSAGFPSTLAAGATATRVSTAQVERLQSLLSMHDQRAQDAARDLGYIQTEIQRFEALLEQLETERAQYHTQLEALNRQVDSIRRNERLLSMLRERQSSLQQTDRFETHSLEQISGRLAGIRSQQEAELDLLSGTEMEIDYEGRAKASLQVEDAAIQQQSAHALNR